MSRTFDYAVFGLTLRSDMPLPELFPAAQVGVPDVTIKLGSIPMITQAEDDGSNQLDGALALIVPEVARYRIEAGSRITVESKPGVPERNVRLFLLGSAFGILLHQRGLLPLHANAIEIGGRAVAFMGPSGAGKSTLAAWFQDGGFRIIADDVCVVGFNAEGLPYAAPGLPRLRLWREALQLMGRDVSHYDRSYVDPAQDYDKFDVPIASQSAARGNSPLAALYLLEKGNDFAISRIGGVEAAEAIFANTYRGSFVFAARTHEDHWQNAIRLVRSVPIYRVRRVWELAAVERQNRELLDAVAADVGSSSADMGQAP